MCIGKHPRLDRGCRSLPHLTEPFSDSPVRVGGEQWQTSTPGRRGCQSSPHRVEPFSDSPTMVGAAHRHESTPRRGEGELSAAATPRGAVTKLARDGGRRRPASIHACMKGDCQPPPNLAEPLPDSTAMVGDAHRQASMPGRRSGCRPPPHHTEP
jgi:hypothetical protein